MPVGYTKRNWDCGLFKCSRATTPVIKGGYGGIVEFGMTGALNNLYCVDLPGPIIEVDPEESLSCHAQATGFEGIWWSRCCHQLLLYVLDGQLLPGFWFFRDERWNCDEAKEQSATNADGVRFHGIRSEGLTFDISAEPSSMLREEGGNSRAAHIGLFGPHLMRRTSDHRSFCLGQ